MRVRELSIAGVFEFEPQSFGDERGLFTAPFQADVFVSTVGHPLRLGQTNHSVSRRGTIRGVHFADTPPGQAKYIYCPRGSMLDVLTFVNPPAQLDALFATGGAWIGFNGSARIGELAARGVPVALANPKEGSVLNPNQFVIVKNGPNADLAHKFIDFALALEAQHDIAKTMMLGPVNKNVKLEPEIAATVPYGDAVAKLWAIPQDPINEDMSELTLRWTSVVSKK